MPCSDGGPSYEDYVRQEKIEEGLKTTKKNLDFVTSLLCFVMRTPKKDWKKHPDLMNWWEKHQEEDRIRIEKETKAKEENIRKRKAAIKLLQKEIEELENGL